MRAVDCCVACAGRAMTVPIRSDRTRLVINIDPLLLGLRAARSHAGAAGPADVAEW